MNGLRKSTARERKELGKFQSSEMDKLGSSISFDLQSEILYLFKNFHAHPHGAAVQQERGQIEDQFSKRNIPFKHISITACDATNHRYTDSDNIKVFYIGSPEMLTLMNDKHRPNKAGLARFILQYGHSDGGVRDRVLAEDAVAKRYFLGFSPSQAKHSKRSQCLPNKYGKTFLFHSSKKM